MNGNKGKYLLITALSAINMLCMPILSYHRGLFPSNTLSIFDMLETSAGSYKNFALMLLVPTVAMLIAALMDKGGFFKAASFVGVVWTGVNIFSYAADEGFDELLSDDTSIAIGVWIGLVLFIWGFASSESGDNATSAADNTHASGGTKAGGSATAAGQKRTTTVKKAAPKTATARTATAKTAVTKTSSTQGAANTTTSAKPAGGKKRCPVCGTSNSATDQYCKQCGITIKS